MTLITDWAAPAPSEEGQKIDDWVDVPDQRAAPPDTVPADQAGIVTPDAVSGAALPAPGEDLGRLGSAAGSFMQGIAGVGASFPKAAATAEGQRRLRLNTILDQIDAGTYKITGREPDAGFLIGYQESGPEDRAALRADAVQQVDPRQMAPYKAGEAIEQAAKEQFPSHPVYEKEWISGTLPKAGGSAAGFMATGLLGAAVKLPAAIPMIVAGAASNSSEMFEDALKKGASLEDAFRASNMGAVVGTSEAIPIISLFNRWDKATAGGVRKFLLDVLKQGGEELTQETFSALANNLIASGLVAYDPERGIFQGVGEAAGTGFTIGALMQTAAGLLAGRRGRAPPRTQTEVEQDAIKQQLAERQAAGLPGPQPTPAPTPEPTQIPPAAAPAAVAPTAVPPAATEQPPLEQVVKEAVPNAVKAVEDLLQPEAGGAKPPVAPPVTPAPTAPTRPGERDLFADLVRGYEGAETVQPEPSAAVAAPPQPVAEPAPAVPAPAPTLTPQQQNNALEMARGQLARFEATLADPESVARMDPDTVAYYQSQAESLRSYIAAREPAAVQEPPAYVTEEVPEGAVPAGEPITDWALPGEAVPEAVAPPVDSRPEVQEPSKPKLSWTKGVTGWTAPGFVIKKQQPPGALSAEEARRQGVVQPKSFTVTARGQKLGVYYPTLDAAKDAAEAVAAGKEAPIAEAITPKPRKKPLPEKGAMTLVQFIMSKGGINPKSNQIQDLRDKFGGGPKGNFFVPGKGNLIRREGGLTLDEMQEQTRINKYTTDTRADELLEALGSDRNRLPRGEELAPIPKEDEAEKEVQRNTKLIVKSFEEAGIPESDLNPETLRRAAQALVGDEFTNPADMYDRVAEAEDADAARAGGAGEEVREAGGEGKRPRVAKEVIGESKRQSRIGPAGRVPRPQVTGKDVAFLRDEFLKATGEELTTIVDSAPLGTIMDELEIGHLKGEQLAIVNAFKQRLKTVTGDTPVFFLTEADLYKFKGITQDMLGEGRFLGGSWITEQGPNAREMILINADMAADAETRTNTVLHEGTHAAAYGALESKPHLKRQIRLIMDAARKHIEGIEGVDIKEIYAFTDEHEFLSESMSKDEVQELLSLLPASPELVAQLGDDSISTMWDAFVELVRRLIGASPKSRTLLDAILQVSEIATREKMIAPVKAEARMEGKQEHTIELPDKAVADFTELGQLQRGKPEDAMLRVQKANGGGVLNPVVEHVGDLTHRMTALSQYGNAGFTDTKPKVDRAIRALDYPYGFEKEMEENLRENAKARGVDPDEMKANVFKRLDKYAEEHAKLPVYNQAQQLARDAAVQIGKREFRKASQTLKELQKLMPDAATWEQHAFKYEPAVTEEKGAEGKPQMVIPGAEQRPKEALQRKAETPLKAKQIQKAMDIGLFSDESKQEDMFASPSNPPPKTAQDLLDLVEKHDKVTADIRSALNDFEKSPRFEIRLGDKRRLVTRNIGDKDAPYRITYVDQYGPSGHMEFRNLDEVAEELTRDVVGGFKAVTPKAQTEMFAIRDAGQEAIEIKLAQRNYPKLGKILGFFGGAGVGRFRNEWSATEWRVKVQDIMLRWRRAQEQWARDNPGQTLPPDMDVYRWYNLSFGKKDARMKAAEKKYLDPIVKEINDRGLTYDEVGDYLYAMHAEERNRDLRAINPAFQTLFGGDPSGMSDADARVILQRASARQADYDAVAKLVRAMINDTLDMQVRDGLLTPQMVATWRARWPNYVPLRHTETGEGWMGVGKGSEVRGREYKPAFGREKRADNPLSFAFAQMQHAIIRGENNAIGQAVGKFVQANPEPSLWKFNVGPKTTFIDTMTGLVTTRTDPNWRKRDDVFTWKENGVEQSVYFVDPDYGAKLARALKHLEKGQMNKFLLFASSLTRTMARLATSLNPEFMISNFFRDVGEAYLLIPAEKRKGLGKAWRKHLFRAVRGAWQGERGGTGRYADAYREFVREGGRIGFLGEHGAESVERDIKKTMKLAQKGALNTARKKIKALTELLNDVNGAIENGTRLAMYMAAKDISLTNAHAASLAREATVNFNRKGEWGSILSAGYMFANAGIQGPVRMMGALKTSSGVRKAAAGLAGIGALLAVYNIWAGGDDEDGTSKYSNIAEWERDANFIFMYPDGSGNYLKIPAPLGFVMFKAVGDHLASAFFDPAGHPIGKTLGGIFMGIVSAFDPLGRDQGMFAHFVPSALKAGEHIRSNEDAFGRPINPNKQFYNKFLPDSHDAFRTASPWAEGAAQNLNELSGGTNKIPGYVDIGPGTFDYMVGFVTGGTGRFLLNTSLTLSRLVTGQEWAPEKTPFVRRFYGEVKDESQRSKFYNEREETQKAYQQKRAEDPEYMAAKRFRAVDKSRTAISKEMRAVKDDETLSYAERDEKLKALRKQENELMHGARQYLESIRAQAEEREPRFAQGGEVPTPRARPREAPQRAVSAGERRVRQQAKFDWGPEFKEGEWDWTTNRGATGPDPTFRDYRYKDPQTGKEIGRDIPPSPKELLRPDRTPRMGPQPGLWPDYVPDPDALRKENQRLQREPEKFQLYEQGGLVQRRRAQCSPEGQPMQRGGLVEEPEFSPFCTEHRDICWFHEKEPTDEKKSERVFGKDVLDFPDRGTIFPSHMRSSEEEDT